MLHVCYMFEQHVTWLNPFVQGHLSHIMLYGYMFFAKFVSVDWQIKAQGVDKTKTTVSSLGNSGPPLKIQLA